MYNDAFGRARRFPKHVDLNLIGAGACESDPPHRRRSACVSSFRVTMNSKPSLTVMCSAEPSSSALVIGFDVLSSDGSAS